MVSEDFFMKAHNILKQVEELNLKVMSKELMMQRGIKLRHLDSGILSREVNDKFYSPYHSKAQFLVIVQNPTNQVHEQLLKLDIPYREFDIKQLKADGTSHAVTYDQSKPKVFFNSDHKQI